LGVLGLLGLSVFWFYICTPLLLVNFSWIVSASGCRHIGPNHLNLGVLCGCVVFFILHFSISLLILEFAFVTTSCFNVSTLDTLGIKFWIFILQMSTTKFEVEKFGG
jgi:hypothetical protein